MSSRFCLLASRSFVRFSLWLLYNSSQLFFSEFSVFSLLSLESPKSVDDVCTKSLSILIFAMYGRKPVFLIIFGWPLFPVDCFMLSRRLLPDARALRRSSRFKWNEKTKPPKIVRNTKAPPTTIVVMSWPVNFMSQMLLVLREGLKRQNYCFTWQVAFIVIIRSVIKLVAIDDSVTFCFSSRLTWLKTGSTWNTYLMLPTIGSSFWLLELLNVGFHLCPRKADTRNFIVFPPPPNHPPVSAMLMTNSRKRPVPVTGWGSVPPQKFL